jgi:hypothetical protein
MRKKFRCVLRDFQKLLSPEDDVETCVGILAKLQVESKLLSTRSENKESPCNSVLMTWSYD